MRVQFSKAVDEIEQPELMPEDYYLFVIAKEPEIKDNNAKKEDPASEKAGENMVISLMSISEDAPEFAGRRFTAYLPIPKPEDEDNYDGIGMKVYDSKMLRITDFGMAAGAEIVDDAVDIKAGLKIGIKVIQEIDKRTGTIRNSLDVFNSLYKTEEELNADGEYVPGEPE